MRKIICIVVVSAFVLGSKSQAQCPGGRYVNQIFSSVNVDSVVYSTPYNLKMDIYQPAGDTLSARPVIILAHEGSFVDGTRESDVTVDSLCMRFARRGYVTVSIDYRLGNLVNMLTDSSAAVAEVIQAMGDGKAAVRFFVKDAATVNTYKIDTNNIFIGGNSAGAVLYMHVGYVESISDCPADIVAAMDSNGGFEGNSGNAGYTTRSKAIVDLAGGLNDPSFVMAGGKPSVNAQGTLDNVVPYTCGLALEGYVNVTLCGLGTLEPIYVADDIYHMSLVFPGLGHVPWDTSATDFKSVDSIVTLFLYNMVCTDVTSVNAIPNAADVSLYPNPVSDVLNISSSQALGEVELLDETGRIVLKEPGANRQDVEINTVQFAKGVYFVKLKFADGAVAPMVKNIVVE